MSCVSLLYFCARKQKTSMGEIPQHAKHTPITPLHDSGTHSAHFTLHIHILDYAEYCLRHDKLKRLKYF